MSSCLPLESNKAENRHKKYEKNEKWKGGWNEMTRRKNKRKKRGGG